MISMGYYRVFYNEKNHPVKIENTLNQHSYAVASVSINTGLRDDLTEEQQLWNQIILQCVTVEGYVFDGECSFVKCIGYLDKTARKN